MPAGRPEGAPNKNKERLLNTLRKEYGADFEPVMEMARHAVAINKEVETGAETHKNAIDAWDKIAKYTTPQLKAVEVSGPGGGPIEHKETNITPEWPTK